MPLTPVEVPEDVRAGGVRVWRADLDCPPVGLGVLARTLSEDERTRACRFHQPRDRDRFVAARGLLRVLLGDALACPPPALRFRYNPYGKPALAADGARLGFNLSHSDGTALFALAWGREVGVDVERVRPQLAAESLAERFLPVAEAAALRSLPPALQSDAFTRSWVRHEAYLKALGTGFSASSPPPDRRRWACLDLPVGPEHRAALVVKTEVSRPAAS